MSAPLRERALLQAARDVLSKTAVIEPVLGDYRDETGVTHPLQTALSDLQAAVGQYEQAG